MVNETVPILLGAPMGVAMQFVLPAFFVDGPTFSDGRVFIEIEGARDASGNRVPIFAASQVPEPNEFAALGVCLALSAVPGELLFRVTTGQVTLLRSDAPLCSSSQCR